MIREQSENTAKINDDPSRDADSSGKLATSLFVGVILLLLVLIYAFATAS